MTEDDQADLTVAYMAGFERGKDAAAATITAQAQEIERLRGALEPFDDALGEDEPHLSDSEKVVTKYGPCTDYSLTLGDFRRARAATRKETTA